MPSTKEYPPFPGIRPEGMAFLRALADPEHQDREWFEERKHLYTDELRWPLRCLVADVLRRVGREDAAYLYGDPRKSVFRIYRDMRFTNDKRPYQTHVACKFTPRSDLSEKDGVVYVHVEPDNVFFAAGLYKAPAKRLLPIRKRMTDDPEGWEALLRQYESIGLRLEGDGDGLKGMPRGFSSHRDSDLAPYLKWTSLVAVESVSEECVQDPALASDVADFAWSARDLLTFIGHDSESPGD